MHTLQMRSCALLSLLISVGALSAAQDRAPRARAELVRRAWSVNGVSRSALVHLPEGASEEPTPVVFAFHGHGGSMRGAARGFRLHEVWPEAIVVYPQGLKTPGKFDPEGKLPGWQKSAGDQSDRDLEFFDAILASLQDRFMLDPLRVHATGHSNGGAFTYLLWARRAEVLASLAPSSSGFARSLRSGPLEPRPILHLAGTQDTVVPFAHQERVIQGLLRVNRCAEGRPREGHPGYTVYPSQVGAQVETFIHPGGHRYPGEAPALIVDFFRRNPKASPRVQVYILAGQSNMEGHGQLRSLEMLGEHPEHGRLLQKLKAKDGSWAVRDDVTIAWRAKERAAGQLSVGWGVDESEIGPELMFGTLMGEHHEAPVLLIKVAWGGKDVYCDFRSPSAGDPEGDEQALLEHQRRQDDRQRPLGECYRRMLAEVRSCLEDLEEVVPGYEGQGYEVAGLAWFQGWNDFCEWHLLVDGQHIGLGIIERYPHNLAAMFRDLRRDLGVPELPIVVGELGVGGQEMTERAENDDDHEARAMVAFRRAQRAACEDTGLEGVTFVPTSDYWDARLQELRRLSDEYWNEKQEKGIADTEENHLPTSELNAEYLSRGGHWYCHYNGSATNYSLVGYALAEALLGR